MHDPEELRKLARRCRERAQSSADPDTIDLLRCWAVELADAADVAEWNAVDPGDPEMARILFEGEDESTNHPRRGTRAGLPLYYQRNQPSEGKP